MVKTPEQLDWLKEEDKKTKEDLPADLSAKALPCPPVAEGEGGASAEALTEADERARLVAMYGEEALSATISEKGRRKKSKTKREGWKKQLEELKKKLG